MYRVVVERSAEKDLRRLPLDARLRVTDALRSLPNNPRPMAEFARHWSLPQGRVAQLYAVICPQPCLPRGAALRGRNAPATATLPSDPPRPRMPASRPASAASP